MKFGVIIFPGSNCDYDAYRAVKDVLKEEVEFLWHQNTSLDDCDCVILPGGFSYGDYLRTGAIARFSPIMKKVLKFAQEGGLVLGICNGFQMLIEAGLLPGALLPNAQTTFVCKWTTLRVESTDSRATEKLAIGDQLMIPVSHGEGRYYCAPETLKQLYRENRVVFKYVNENGEPTPDANPNGAIDNIAGIFQFLIQKTASNPPNRLNKEIIKELSEQLKQLPNFSFKVLDFKFAYPNLGYKNSRTGENRIGLENQNA